MVLKPRSVIAVCPYLGEGESYAEGSYNLTYLYNADKMHENNQPG